MGDPTIHVLTTEEGARAASYDINAGPEIEVIRNDIEQTRAEMSGTIDAIQRKLDPTLLKEHVTEEVIEQIAEARDALREAVHGKRERTPVLIGLGGLAIGAVFGAALAKLLSPA